jgi:hypothetical protein
VTDYRVTFDRIGRTRDVPPQTFAAADPDALAEAVWSFARPYCGSLDLSVSLRLDGAGGALFAGVRNAGAFVVEPPAPAPRAEQ